MCGKGHKGIGIENTVRKLRMLRMNGIQENQIQPIQTMYRGHKFRSRLEARWAVFFDHLKIKYEYEAEGYKNPNTASIKAITNLKEALPAQEASLVNIPVVDTWLPDFWLTEEDILVEIKPCSFWESLDDGGIPDKQYKFFTKFASILNKHIFLIIGTVSPGEYGILWFRKGTGLPEGGVWVWAQCRKCIEGIYLSSTHGWAEQIFSCADDCKTNNPVGMYWPLENNGRILNALNAAKSARFEHGEKG